GPRSKPKGTRGAPGRGLPFFFACSRNCHRAPLGGRTGRRTMFARTPRLLLRPGFSEDAPALAAAIADQAVVRNLATAPWPYRMRDAEAFLASPRDPVLPSFLIFERTDGAPRL